jgi:site-specific recombinase XerC
LDFSSRTSGLRRAELVSLEIEDCQIREEHWVIVDLTGKAKHVRTVPVPARTKRAVNEWTTARLASMQA